MLEHDFHTLIVKHRELLDVRAPMEFTAGSIPGAVNVPLLDDQERHLVGICYREKGKAAALHLGQQLVSGGVREARVGQWHTFLEQFPNTRIYCARGGMRSETAQSWIKEHTGRDVPRLRGGYKAFRKFLLDHLEPDWLRSSPVILGGRTGAGKTVLLKQLPNGIDLEGLANHRGSSFGRFTTPQPGQADFENRLAREMILNQEKGFATMILEDEGRHVGKRFLPLKLSTYFNSGPLVILSEPVEVRIQNTFAEYVANSQLEYRQSEGEQLGLQRWLENILDGVGRIAKRLGSEKFSEVQTLIEHAQRTQLNTGDTACHRDWIAWLLKDYYDPMYDYQIEKKKDKIVFRGDRHEVLEYLKGLG
jgi:tRNA 2-selenouridine synthase